MGIDFLGRMQQALGRRPLAAKPPAVRDANQLAPDHPANMLLGAFVSRLHGVREANVLELGTLRSQPERSTVHRAWAAADAVYVCSDFQDGLDVDVVADIHVLSQAFAPDSQDAIIACSVFEHVQRPWIGAAEIARVLRPGGQVFVQTHFAFPIHGYPSDYWRYTREALETIFGADAGLRVVGSAYQFPVRLIAPELPPPETIEAYLNVCLVAEKAG
jgi:SAM-dependent methyltransferase